MCHFMRQILLILPWSKWWKQQNQLKLIPQKTHSLSIQPSVKYLSSPKNPSSALYQQSKSTTYLCVQSTKCLGVIIDQHLNWEAHISDTCKNFFAKVKKLYSMRAMSKTTLNTIYFQGILPSAIYGILIWGSSNHLFRWH